MRHIIPFLLTVLITFSSSANDLPKDINANDDGLAVQGYDVVAYFTRGEPTEGLEDYELKLNGVTYRFASEDNLLAFQASPSSYLPQYGGFCAYGVANGKKASIDPAAWTILNGKLYLNYSLKIKEDWDKDRATYIQQADELWPDVKNKSVGWGF